MLSHGERWGDSSSSPCRLHASWQIQDFSQPKRITCSPITHLLPAPGWPQCMRCQALPGLPACPPYPPPWESPAVSPAGSGLGGWATQSCKTLLSSKALGRLLTRVKIITSIFWLRKRSCKASEVTYPGLPPPKRGSYSPKNFPLSSFNEAFQIIPQSWTEQGYVWSISPFQSWLNTERCKFFFIIILLLVTPPRWQQLGAL